MKTQIDQDKLFRKMTLQIASCREIETALKRCLDLLSTVMPVDYMALHQYTQKTGVMRTHAIATPQGGWKTEHAYQFPDSLLPEIERRDDTRVWVADHIDDDPLMSRVAKAIGFSDISAMLMELEMNHRPPAPGLISVSNCQNHHYTKSDTDLLIAMNEPLALGLTNGLRFTELTVIRDHLENDNNILLDELSRVTTKPVIGGKKGLRGVMEQVAQVAPTSSPILLLGQTGTGKEVIARAIHQASPRSSHPFISVNCGALPHHLADSELFGHEKGAFTGAAKKHIGYFERAHGGTLFLDEIGELTPDIQVRLLRVLQEKEVDRVGGSSPVDIDTRVIAATNRDLEKLVAQGRFREDLYFRVRVFPIQIPPLKERTGDIGELTRHFIDAKSFAMNRFPTPEITEASLEKLRSYSWPGNVRELENMVERALILHQSGPLSIDPSDPGTGSTEPLPSAANPDVGKVQTLDQVVTDYIRHVLDITGGRVGGRGGAAELLNVNPSTLRARMKKYGIEYGYSYQKPTKLSCSPERLCRN